MKETTLSGGFADIPAENIHKLKELFPEVFCEQGIDFDKLRAILGDAVDERDERYNFTWWGRSRTLRPCREESKDWDTTGNLHIEGGSAKANVREILRNVGIDEVISI